jgi:hypothetical protein
VVPPTRSSPAGHRGYTAGWPGRAAGSRERGRESLNNHAWLSRTPSRLLASRGFAAPKTASA